MTIHELNKLGAKALMKFWHRVYLHPVRTARELFPYRHKGYVTETRALGNYAANRAAMLTCKARGDKLGVKVYEMCCDTCVDQIYRA